MKEIILIKNGELILKGLNRNNFEDILIKNIKRRLKDLGSVTIRKAQSAIYIEPADEFFDFDEALQRISLIFGIVGFSRACVCEKSAEDIFSKAVPYLKESLETASTFKVEAKQTVAFVGSTGSGKTTILSLICRNYDIQKGRILIDGIDIRKIKIASLRKHFGQMLQDVFLFSGDIRGNIVLREEQFTDEQIWQACRYVNADSFISRLDKGLDEVVRERGNNFSAGQRQLLSFARTIIHRPAVMILDEATANIDTETEILIQDSLEKMKNIGTMLIVAHRLSTIQHADNIILLADGEIIEQGNHQELLRQKGRYYQLYTIQYHKQQLMNS